MTSIFKYVNIYNIILLKRKDFVCNMDNEFDVVIENDTAFIFTPYSDKFITTLKETIPGRLYVPQAKCWAVPLEYLSNVRKIMMDVFGKTDETTSTRGDVEVKMLHDIVANDKPLYLMGKILAVPETETYDGIITDSNVIFKKGNIEISKENHTLTLKKGTVLIFKRMKAENIVKSNFYDVKVL